MKKVIFKALKQIFSPYIGKKSSQGFFRKLYNLSLKGMNIGEGAGVNDTGEIWVLKFAESIFGKKNPTIFDVGANEGNYTKLLMKIFKSSSTIHAFEPSKKTFKILSKNFSGNKNIVLNDFGLGKKNEKVTLYSFGKYSGLSSIFDRKLEHKNFKGKTSQIVRIKTLDRYCQEKKIKKIDFLKLDVEGNEINVLKGSERMLKSRSIDLIQFEFGGCNIDSRTYFRDFWHLLKNYEIYRILKDGLYLIQKYDEKDEIFTTTNFLAISKNKRRPSQID